MYCKPLQARMADELHRPLTSSISPKLKGGGLSPPLHISSGMSQVCDSRGLTLCLKYEVALHINGCTNNMSACKDMQSN